MKQLVICILMMLSFSLGSFSQNVVKNGNTFSVVSTKSHKTDSLKTKYFYENTTGKYPIFINKKSGACYYWCKSKEGKLYKRYCLKQVSAQISAEYGIEYKPKTK